ncbi:MAG: LptE family protein [bacterium]|nr:LptE family protein [bacterium]
MNRFLLLLTTYCLLFIILGCTYTPRLILPTHIKKLTIPIFANKTIRYGLEEKLTNAVIDEFISDGKFDVVPKNKADAKLIGEIIGFSEDPISYNEQGEIIEYEIWISINLSFYDIGTEKVLWEDKINRVTTYNPIDTSFEEAVTSLLETLAKDVVSRTIKGW